MSVRKNEAKSYIIVKIRKGLKVGQVKLGHKYRYLKNRSKRTLKLNPPKL